MVESREWGDAPSRSDPAILTNLSTTYPGCGLPLLAASILALAACGGDSDPEKSASPSKNPRAGRSARPDDGGSSEAGEPGSEAGGGGTKSSPPTGMTTAGRSAAGAAADGGRGGKAGQGGTGGTGGTSGRGAAGELAAGIGGSEPAGDAGPDGSVEPDAGPGEPPPDPSDEIFSPDNVPRFDIILPEASRAALAAITSADDPRQDEYVAATFRYGSEELANVGVRIKGEGSFRDLTRKTPFKIKFDEFVAGQAFRGLKRITLNNMVEDPSFIAERLAYELFREAGLPAPRCNNARVYVDGEFYGVYANVESEDKAFLRRWFTDDGGNLYEEGQRDFVPGSETSFDLETNESANDRTNLVALIAAIDGSSAATFLADLEPHLDVAHFLRFTAAEAAVNQWDMYAHTLFWPNNFRFYDDPTRGTFVFLPWGMDMSMKPYRETGRKHISVFGLARQFDLEERPISAGLMFQRCLESFECKERYAAAVAEIIEVYERLDLEARAARYHAQIREYVLMDTRKELSTQLFDEGHQMVVQTIRERPGAMRADLTAQ